MLPPGGHWWALKSQEFRMEGAVAVPYWIIIKMILHWDGQSEWTILPFHQLLVGITTQCLQTITVEEKGNPKQIWTWVHQWSLPLSTLPLGHDKTEDVLVTYCQHVCAVSNCNVSLLAGVLQSDIFKQNVSIFLVCFIVLFGHFSHSKYRSVAPGNFFIQTFGLPSSTSWESCESP